jgi:hypothetical protein
VLYGTIRQKLFNFTPVCIKASTSDGVLGKCQIHRNTGQIHLLQDATNKIYFDISQENNILYLIEFIGLGTRTIMNTVMKLRVAQRERNLLTR